MHVLISSILSQPDGPPPPCLLFKFLAQSSKNTRKPMSGLL